LCRVGAQVEALESTITVDDKAWRPGVVTDIVERVGSPPVMQVHLSGDDDPTKVCHQGF
jgi:hypothetical protein